MMKEDTFEMSSTNVYSTVLQKLAVKAVVVGTVGTQEARMWGHGNMLPKFSRLMLEMCLDFVKLFCDDNERSQTRLKMTYTRHDQILK